MSSHSWFRPLAEHGLDARQVALGLADLHWVGELGGGPPQAQMEELVGELVLARAQLDVAQVTHFLPFHLMLLGARPVLAPCGRCALPMPPDPVGQLERSRARPPSLLGARPVLAPCGRCALPMPPDPVGQPERSPARPPTLLGARPVLAPCGRCALPMPPDPVGQPERSPARPPTLLGARPVLAPCGRC